MGYSIVKSNLKSGAYDNLNILIPSNIDALSSFTVFQHQEWYWGFKTVSTWHLLSRKQKVSLKNFTHFCDFGAHVGLFSFLATKDGLTGIAVEANPNNITLLKQNLNGLPVEVVDKAVVPESFFAEKVGFDTGSRSTNGRINFSGRNEHNIGHIKVSEAIAKLSLAENDSLLIKMDVEGAEWEILEFLPQITGLVKNVGFLIEVHERYEGESHQLIEKFEQLGFSYSKLNRTGASDILAVRRH